MRWREISFASDSRVRATGGPAVGVAVDAGLGGGGKDVHDVAVRSCCCNAALGDDERTFSTLCAGTCSGERTDFILEVHDALLIGALDRFLAAKEARVKDLPHVRRRS